MERRREAATYEAMRRQALRELDAAARAAPSDALIARLRRALDHAAVASPGGPGAWEER